MDKTLSLSLIIFRSVASLSVTLSITYKLTTWKPHQLTDLLMLHLGYQVIWISEQSL